MSYIPPHLRIASGQQRPSPEVPCFSSRGPSRKQLLPDVTIVKAEESVSRLIVSSRHPVKFVEFDGESFAHLQQHQLYVLEPAITDNEDADQAIYGCSLQDPPVSQIFGALNKDIEDVLQKFKKIACATNVGRLLPFMWLKFGKALFRCPSGQVEWHKTFRPRDVEEMNSERHFLSMTFDTSVSMEVFSALRMFACRDASKSWTKDRYIIQVSDDARPDSLLLCVCKYFKDNEERSVAAGKSGTSALTLSKVRLSPVRHLIGDIACVGKQNDVRLMFYVQEFLTMLSKEEYEDLQSCLSKAQVRHTAKGGLFWPIGSKQSSSGRFKIVGNVHERRTVVVGSGLRWSLQECNRVEFKASSGRVTYEASVRPVIYHEFCKVREEHTIEELACSIMDMLHQIWKDTIES